MKINIYYLSTKKSSTQSSFITDYINRFSSQWSVSFIALYYAHVKNKSASTILNEEHAIISQQMDGRSFIALDRLGQSLNSMQFAIKIQAFSEHSRVVNFVIGGAIGLAANCLKEAHHVWSLSALTLPHSIARLVLTEQLYRSYTILSSHPYHK